MHGFTDLPCPLCAAEGCVSVRLHALDEFDCSECNQDFDRSTITQFLERWGAALAWLDTAPSRE